MIEHLSVIEIQKLRLTIWARGIIFDFINRNQRHNEGYCMCGDKIEEHGFGSGHAPVDAWYYYREQFVHRGKL